MNFSAGDHPSEASGSDSVEKLQRSRRLFGVGLVGVSALVAYYLLNGDAESPTHLQLGGLIIVLAAVPALSWARSGSFRFPVFEVFMLTGITSYALPLLNSHEHLSFHDPAHVTLAALAVILFQGVALTTFYFTSGRPKRSPFWTEELFSREAQRYIRYGVMATPIYSYLAQYTELIPSEFVSVIRAVLSGVGIACTFITARAWGTGDLRRGDKTILVLSMLAHAYLNMASLVMITTMSMTVLALVGYVSGSKHVPVVLVLVLTLGFGIFHNGKSTMRARYWIEEQRHTIEVGMLPRIYSEWIQAGISPPRQDEEEAGDGIAGKLIDRASLFHIVCLVVSVTPERQPFLDGLTYTYIPSQLIPRLFWPEKPVAHIATHTLGIYYGLINEESTKHTTIAFGMLAEAYANFGMLGAALLGAVAGFGLRKVTVWASESPMLSPGGLLLVVLMAWSFQVELTMSVWISSFFQACVAVLGLPIAMKRLFG